jgi:TolB-like protein/DNA-binding winged helix-turn-helix (wHTH) protein
MNTPAEPILVFAGYVLDPRRRLLIGPDGVPVEISSRAFETLHYLASHPHESIEKHRLMKAVWGNSVVEENNLNQQISTLRKILGDAAGEHRDASRRFIVTITGQGYRFVQDVQQLESLATNGGLASTTHVTETEPSATSRAAAETDVSTPSGTPTENDPPELGGYHEGSAIGGCLSWRTSRPLIAAAVALMLIVGAAWVLLAGSGSGRPMPIEAPSIAVLPFVDLSANHDQGYFADGLSEELLSALGGLEGLRVIGRTSSFSFRGKHEDVRQIAATLGVRHVLEGSVRRDGDRLRITAQLVDATNGSQLWAEAYDRRLGDIFAIQKQIADSVAVTLQLQLRLPHVAASSGGTRNFEAYEAYLAARAVTNNVGSTRARDAIRLLERAVHLDPNFAGAWAALAEAYTFAADFPPSMALPLTPVELQQRISRAALRALELAPDAPQSLRSAGMVSMQSRDWTEAARRLRKAVDLAGPYDYEANLLYAWFLMNVGRATAAIPYEERAMRAEPLLLRPVTLRAALHEMHGELEKAEALLMASTGLSGHEAMRRQGLIMIRLASRDRHGAMRLGNEKGGALPCSSLDDPPRALADLRRHYEEAIHSGVSGQLIPVALYASLLGDQTLALNALRAVGATTQSLFPIWRPALSEVRRLPGFEEFVRDVGLVDYWRASGDWGEFCRETAGGGFTCR